MDGLGNICGQWRLVYADNIAEYCDAIGTPDNMKEVAIQLLGTGNDVVQDISFHDNTVTIATRMPGRKTEVVAKLGEDVQYEFLDGRKLTCTFSRDGDRLVEEQTGAFRSTNTRYVQDGQLVMTQTSYGGVTSTRKYSLI